MLWRDNERENTTVENGKPEVTAESTGTDATADNDRTKTVLDRIETLKKQMEDLRASNGIGQNNEIAKKTEEAITNAAAPVTFVPVDVNKNSAVIEQARKEALKKREQAKASDAEAKPQAAEVVEQPVLTEREKKAQAAKLRKQLEHEKKQSRQKLIEQQRRLQRQIREEAIAEEKRLKSELHALKRGKKSESKKASEKSKISRQRSIAEKSAELGGGIVNVHGMTVTTEIRPVAKYSIRDLLGISKRKAKKQAQNESELQEILEESEKRKEQARHIAAQLSALRWERRKNSAIGRAVSNFFDFCERKKKPLLIAFSIVLIVGMSTAGVMNYYTLFEYSYNGKTLGYVKDRDTVLQITDMVQNALTVDSDVDVVIDSRKDIEFKRRLTLGKNYTADSSDEVLKRLTYMGNLNVKAYGIFVDGKKVGAVDSKETAANVLLDIEEKYASKKEGSKIEEASIIEEVKVRLSNTDLEDVYSEARMVEALCKDREVDTVHTVSAGETMASIAESYGIKEAALIESNPDVDPENLTVGTVIVIKEFAPIITVQLTEIRTYNKTIKYEVEKKKDKTIYEGYSEVTQKGVNGLSEITDRTYSVNGKVAKTENVETVVKKKAVNKIINVGTKYKPPEVGTGEIIWPAAKNSYTVTSEFKWRWGRQHQGMDLGCSVGTDVLAVDDGEVTFSGSMGGYGNLVIIDHHNGMQTYYGHNSSLCVNVGDVVRKGDHIAEAGNTGRSTGPHIHLGVMIDGTFVNPREYLPEENNN